MSGNQPSDPPDGPADFPAVGQYDLVPGPGEEGYVEPDDVPDLSDVEADLDDAEGDDADGDDDDSDDLEDEIPE